MPFFNERSKEQSRDADRDLIDLDSLFVPLHGRPASVVEPEVADDEYDEDDTASLPQITKMPEGITVVEHQIGHAIGQWVFVLLCDCGRRWFTLRAVEKAQCPRCDRWVHVEADPQIPG
jgi:hypothetical protein